MIEVGRVLRHRATGLLAVAVRVSGREARLVNARGAVSVVSMKMRGRAAEVAGYQATETRLAGGVVVMAGTFIAVAGDDEGPPRVTEDAGQRDLDGLLLKHLRERLEQLVRAPEE